jgi:hypothetical protein
MHEYKSKNSVEYSPMYMEPTVSYFDDIPGAAEKAIATLGAFSVVALVSALLTSNRGSENILE